MTIKYLDSKRIVTSAEGTYGSGGGSGGAVTSGNPTGAAGQGNSGGYGTGSNGNGGGGGGSSSAGTNGSLSSGVGSDGGSGTNNNWTTGSNVGYAGGGAGGHANNLGGSGTATHGAHAGAYPNNVADANTGAGGSAGDSMTENSQVYGGTGGSGIVVVRYLTSGAPTVVSSVTSSTVGSYTVHRFISTGSFQITSGSTSADILVVGGGGSGGTRRHGAGGGAGGYIETLNKSLGVDTYTITIGAGGASTQSTNNVSGSNGTYSAFDDGGGNEIKAKGGGFGGGYNDAGGGGTSPATKPTNVQDNSILVEKDTAKRFWYAEKSISSLDSDRWFQNSSINAGGATTITGKVGTYAWSHDGSNDNEKWRTLSDWEFINDDSTDWTISFWYKNQMGTTSNGHVIMSTYSNANNKNGFLIDVRASQGLRVGFQYNNATASFTAFSYNNVITTGTEWVHYSIVYDHSAKTVKVFEGGSALTNDSAGNGANPQTVADHSTQTTEKPLTVGARFDTQYTAFSMDQLLIHKRKLTDSEITGLWASNNGTTTVPTEKLFLHDNFEQTGSTLVNQNTFGGAWTRDTLIVPTEISDMKGWWDASDSTTITKDASNIVSQWNDKSGNGYNMVTNGANPTLGTQNGLDVIDFAGSKSLKATGEILTQPTTYCLVGLIPVDDGNSRVIFRFGVGLYTKYIKTSTAGQLSLESAAGNSAIPNVSNTWQSQTLIVNGSSSEIKLNNVSQVIGNSGADSPSDVWYLQVNANNNNQHGDSKIAELIVYEKVLSATELADVNAYLVNKWGL